MKLRNIVSLEICVAWSCMLLQGIFKAARLLEGHILTSAFGCLLDRISRLFSDSKKILLYSQNDKNLDGFKELAKALQTLQATTPGRRVTRMETGRRPRSPLQHYCLVTIIFVDLQKHHFDKNDKHYENPRIWTKN